MYEGLNNKAIEIKLGFHQADNSFIIQSVSVYLV